MSDDAGDAGPRGDEDEARQAALGDVWGAVRGLAARGTDALTHRFSSPDLDAALDRLEDDGPTTRLLRAMDFVLPGAWENPRSLDAFVASAVPEAGAERRTAVARAARALYAAAGSRYRRALAVYSAVDVVDRAAAGASLATRIGDRFLVLGALERLTPKAELVQAVDAGAKLAAEAVAFATLRGRAEVSPEGLVELLGGLGRHAAEDRLRLATWVVVDGVLPLGPGFVGRAAQLLRASGEARLAKSVVFDRLAGVIPGESGEQKGSFVARSLEAVASWVDTFVAEHDLDRMSAATRVRRVVDVTGAGFELVAAAADAVASYFRHTGTQTVARAVVRDALCAAPLAGRPPDAHE